MRELAPDAPLVGHDGSAAGPVGARLGQQWSAPGGVAGAGEEVRVEARGGEDAPRQRPCARARGEREQGGGRGGGEGAEEECAERQQGTVAATTGRHGVSALARSLIWQAGRWQQWCGQRDDA